MSFHQGGYADCGLWMSTCWWYWRVRKVFSYFTLPWNCSKKREGIPYSTLPFLSYLR